MRFERLQRYAEPADQAALQLLAEHERALAAFGRDEREGRTGQSISHLLSLLPRAD